MHNFWEEDTSLVFYDYTSKKYNLFVYAPRLMVYIKLYHYLNEIFIYIENVS